MAFSVNDVDWLRDAARVCDDPGFRSDGDLFAQLIDSQKDIDLDCLPAGYLDCLPVHAEVRAGNKQNIGAINDLSQVEATLIVSFGPG